MFVPESDDPKIQEHNLILNAAIYYSVAVFVLLCCFLMFIKVENKYQACKLEKKSKYISMNLLTLEPDYQQ